MTKCEHLSAFKQLNGLQTYKTIHSFFVARRKPSKPNYSQALATCFDCEKFNNIPRLFACLHCVYMGCYEKHASCHSTENDHVLFVELSNGNVFCYSCGDYVYDSDVDVISDKQRWQRKSVVGTANFTLSKSPPWRPSNSENKILQEHPKRIKLEDHLTVGIRGLVNFGTSCFLNCTMQALFHTPILRDYFFTDKHQCIVTKNGVCFYCLVSRLFQDYYSEEMASSVSPHQLYFHLRRTIPLLSGNDQKDAHELYTAIINVIHKYASPSENTNNDGSCTCIVDIIFHGTWQSDVVCKSCGNISPKTESFWDISLNIPGDRPAVDLFECLRDFTKAESLADQIECSNCQSYNYATKQLTFKVLPLIMVIHLKRFKQVNKVLRIKKSVSIPFPVELNMTPFVTDYRNKSKQETPPIKQENVYDNTYTLYAVIEHQGEIDDGHYLAYIRNTRDTWFKCNDATVIPASIEEVMSSQGYILFYHKTVLLYK